MKIICVTINIHNHLCKHTEIQYINQNMYRPSSNNNNNVKGLDSITLKEGN